MRPGDKTARHVGDIVTCACEGCTNTFTVKRHGTHRMYCSKTCRDLAARLGAKQEPPGARKLFDATGGIRPDGSVVSGTRTLARREVIDVACIPQDRPEFWT